MKKLILILSSSIIMGVCHGQAGKDVEITLTINTEQINKKNVLRNVSVTDQDGNSSGYGGADSHTISIYADHKIKWIAEPSNSSVTHKVKVYKIRKKFFKGKTNVLIKKKSTDLDNDGEVVALAKSRWGSQDTESYWIKFSVNKGSGKVVYKLDPKIQIKPK